MTEKLPFTRYFVPTEGNTLTIKTQKPIEKSIRIIRKKYFIIYSTLNKVLCYYFLKFYNS